MLRTLFSMHTKWASGVLVVALGLLGGKPAAAAPPSDQEKTEAKGPSASLRAYLPTIRLKALRDNERQSQRPGPDLATELLLKAEASYARIKRQLLQTWIDYQMVRLDLYGDLGVAPPG